MEYLQWGEGSKAVEGADFMCGLRKYLEKKVESNEADLLKYNNEKVYAVKAKE